jgi:hypothetical protein
MSSLTVAKGAAGAARTALSSKVIGLFRRICRETPRVVKVYELPLTPAEVRHLVGLHFRGNKSVKDPRVVEMLLTKVWELQHTCESGSRWRGRRLSRFFFPSRVVFLVHLCRLARMHTAVAPCFASASRVAMLQDALFLRLLRRVAGALIVVRRRQGRVCVSRLRA